MRDNHAQRMIDHGVKFRRMPLAFTRACVGFCFPKPATAYPIQSHGDFDVAMLHMEVIGRAKTPVGKPMPPTSISYSPDITFLVVWPKYFMLFKCMVEDIDGCYNLSNFNDLFLAEK